MGLRVVDTKAQASKTYKAFYDREYERAVKMPFEWPRQMQEIGEGRAEMYSSNKWKSRRDIYEDYKHVVESTRTVYCEEGWIREWGQPRRKIEVVGPMVTFEEPMPEHFTKLGPLLGLQIRLSRQDDGGEPYLPNGDDSLFEVVAARCSLGAATHPTTKETILFVYDTSGIHALLTGSELGIEKDGIVG